MFEMKGKISKYTGKVFTGLFFFAYCLSQLISVLSADLTRYVTAEWLINYDQGFTRRGLLGTLLTYHFKGQEVLLAVDLLAKSVFLIVIAIFLYLLFKAGKHFRHYAPLLLSPMLLAFPIHNKAVLGRIEWFGFLITIINCYLVKKHLESTVTSQGKSGSGPRWWHTTYVAALPPILLGIFLFVHEGLLLISVPINFIITFVLLLNTDPGRGVTRVIIKTAILYSPVWLVFLLILTKSEYGLEHAVELCEGIRTIDPELVKNTCDELTGPFKYYANSIYNNIPHTLRYVRNYPPPFFLYAILGTFFSFYTVISNARFLELYTYKSQSISNLSYSKGDLETQKSISAGCAYFRLITCYFFLVPIFFTIPLFLTGIDWGRWFFVANSQFLLVLLILYQPLCNDNVSLPFPSALKDGETFHRMVSRANGIRFSYFLLPLLIFRLPYVYPGEGYKMFFTSIFKGALIAFRQIFF